MSSRSVPPGSTPAIAPKVKLATAFTIVGIHALLVLTRRFGWPLDAIALVVAALSALYVALVLGGGRRRARPTAQPARAPSRPKHDASPLFSPFWSRPVIAPPAERARP